MSIKDLFTKSNKILSSEDIETLGEEVESPKLIKEKSVSLPLKITFEFIHSLSNRSKDDF